MQDRDTPLYFITTRVVCSAHTQTKRGNSCVRVFRSRWKGERDITRATMRRRSGKKKKKKRENCTLASRRISVNYSVLIEAFIPTEKSIHLFRALYTAKEKRKFKNCVYSRSCNALVKISSDPDARKGNKFAGDQRWKEWSRVLLHRKLFKLLKLLKLLKIKI